MNTNAKACRVVVVDDDKKATASIKLYLEHGGYQVKGLRVERW